MNKEECYKLLVEQVRALTEGEDDAVSVMANVSAAIHHAMGFWWTGFYVERDGVLRLGPFQCPVACTRIARGRGVCGTALERGRTIVVPDVELFPGHIACSSESRSEIVVPLLDTHGVPRAVLDIDSRELNTFDNTDQSYLEQIAQIVAPVICQS